MEIHTSHTMLMPLAAVTKQYCYLQQNFFFYSQVVVMLHTNSVTFENLTIVLKVPFAFFIPFFFFAWEGVMAYK